MRRRLKFLILLLLFAATVWLSRASGPFLVVDRPQKSDVLIILAGDENDVRLHHGEKLLREGMATRGLLDKVITIREMGKTPAQHAEDYLAQAPPEIRDRMSVCAIAADSTVEEMKAIPPCLEKAGARSVLIVTSDFHTRRSLAVAKKILPQYQWSGAAARTAVSQPAWWQSRWALRNVFIEWEKLVWWKLVDSHRSW